MKKIIYVLFCLLPIQLFAQGNVSGLITDIYGKSLDKATITLYQDGKKIIQERSDSGKFQLSGLNNKQYLLTASMIGYQELNTNFIFPKDSLKLVMKNAVNELKDVVITGHTPLVERRADRITFNVQNSILASGGNVWDALSKVTGVQTNANGQVSAYNKDVTIYIDDRPVQLTGENLTAYLSGLPSANIAKIDVITNPPSKYDAQGGAIINIITKKSKSDGFNASLSGGYTQATLGSYTGAGTFNYRKDKLNVYGNFGFTDKNIQRHLNEYEIYQTPASYADWEGTRSPIYHNRTSTYQLGADYNLTPNQIFGILINGYDGSRSGHSTILNSVYNNHNPSADSTLNTTNNLNGTTNQYSFNVNYKAKLDTLGKTLNVDFDYVPYRNSSIQSVNSITALPNGFPVSSFDINTPSFQNIDIWSGKIDYTYKAGNRWHMESGVKYTNIITNNLFNYFNTAGPQPAFDPARSSDFKYNENTSAIYTSIDGSLGKWEVQGGLRAEYTQTKGNSLTLDSVNKSNYFKLFPSLLVTYKPSQDNVFSLGYDIRIDRPSYQQLNPARSYTSPYSFQQGNPALAPYYITNFDLSYTYQQHFTVAVGFTQMHGLISNVDIADNTSHTIFNTQQNLGNIQDLSLNFLVNASPAPWWELNLDLTGKYRSQSSNYPVGYFSSRNFVFSFSADQSFVINRENGWKAELHTAYRTPINQGLLYIDKTNDISAGVSKSVLNNHGTLKLAFGDILYGNPYRITTNYLGQNNGTYQKDDTRNVTISFTYRLGKGINAMRKRSTASEDEKKRVQ